MSAEQLISFARGAPSLDIVDVEGLKAAAVRAFDADPAGVTAYGTSVGYLPLRQWIADKHGVTPEQVLITNGSLQADAFLFDHLVQPGDAVVVERPTYDRTLLNLRSQGAEVHAVTVQSDGIDTAELRKLLESGVRPKLAHIIPNYQNPAGVTLSEAKRRELLDLAAEYGFTIFEDDPYADIRFRGAALPSMLSLDTAGVVVHASSFTKTVCPGVRVGYLVGPRDLIADIAKRATNLYISPGMVAAGDRAPVLRHRRHRPVDRHGLHGARRARPGAGRVAAPAHPAGALRRARRRLLPLGGPAGVDVGGRSWPRRRPSGAWPWSRAATSSLDGGEHSLRLAFSAVTVDQIDEGVRRLADAMESIRP